MAGVHGVGYLLRGELVGDQVIERIYEGTINGTRFRYSMIVDDSRQNDPAFVKHVNDRADLTFGRRLLADLLSRGVVRVYDEEFEW